MILRLSRLRTLWIRVVGWMPSLLAMALEDPWLDLHSSSIILLSNSSSMMNAPWSRLCNAFLRYMSFKTGIECAIV